MKTNLLSKLYLLSLTIGLSYSSFVEKTPFLQESPWRGIFSANEQKNPFLSEMKAVVCLLNGTQRAPLMPGNHSQRLMKEETDTEKSLQLIDFTHNNQR